MIGSALSTWSTRPSPTNLNLTTCQPPVNLKLTPHQLEAGDRCGGAAT